MRTIKCQICGKEVEAKSSRQKYCPECKKAVHREIDAKRHRERRANDPEYREKVNARDRERYTNSEKRREQYRQSQERMVEDPERHEAKLEYMRRYRKKKLEDPEWREKERVRSREKSRRPEVKAKNKEWYEANKDQIIAKAKKRYEENKVLADREGNNFCIYIHTDPVGKVYVGRSVGEDIKTVSRQRWGSNGINYRGQKFYDECIAIYGWDNIQHELLEWGLTYEEVVEREQYWIERYNSRNPEYGYNVM